MSDNRDDDRWSGPRRGSLDARDRRDERDVNRRDERDVPYSAEHYRDSHSRHDRRRADSPHTGDSDRRHYDRSPDRRRSPSPTRREPPRSPAELTPNTRANAAVQRKTSVELLGYMVEDHHSKHTYVTESERKQMPLMKRSKFMDLFTEGPSGVIAMQSVKSYLGFGKNEPVTLHVQLDGGHSRKMQISDKESFEAWENYLIQSTSSGSINRAGTVVVKMYLDTLVKNLVDKDNSGRNHARADVQLMNVLKEKMGRAKGQKGSSGWWNPNCTETLANSDRADVELKKFLEARKKAKLAFGDGDYVLNPLTMLCPFANCKTATHGLNGLSALTHFFAPKASHLKKMHGADPVAKLLINRLAAVCGNNGNLLTEETLDAKEGKLQLDYEWLEVNMAPTASDPPLSRLRKPSAGWKEEIFCVECVNSDEARAEWIAAKMTAGPSSETGPSTVAD